MKKYSHNYGEYEFKKIDSSLKSKLDKTLRELSFEENNELRSDLEGLLSDWESNGELTGELTLRFGYRKENIQVETQFGNIARYYADILKLEQSYRQGIIDIGILIIPDRDRSKSLGNNVAYFERAQKELKEMREIISCPIVVYGV